jgi:hypothetical protein
MARRSCGYCPQTRNQLGVDPHTYVVGFDGGSLRRGFWLYVWEVTASSGERVYYVGRTGDSSTPNAQSPFNRMGQHLGFLKNQNMLRRHLGARNVDPDQCKFRLVAHGPILDEAETWDDHCARRDVVAALEEALEKTMRAVGYDVMNIVRSRKPLDKLLFGRVRDAFATEFPELAERSDQN